MARTSHGMLFAELPPERKDELVTAIENNTAPGFVPNSRAFFIRVRQLTLEGMFSDPFYGGTADSAAGTSSATLAHGSRFPQANSLCGIR